MTLCLMLKAPHPGAVKTRLARDVGPEKAAAIYRELAEGQLAEIPHGWRVEVHFAPAAAEDEMRAWLAGRLSPGACFFPQADGDLGARLRAALGSAFARGADRVLFAGGDCPDLSRERLIEAAAALESAETDVVVIPARDGGYVLIGFRGPHGAVFENIAWSTAGVLAQTLERIATAGLRHRTLPPALEDVDDLDSWKRCQACKSGRA